MSTHVFSRELIDGRYNVPNPHYRDIAGSPVHIAKQVEEALPGKRFTLHCAGIVAEFRFEDELTQGEEGILATVVSDHKKPTSSIPNWEFVRGPTIQILGKKEEFMDPTWGDFGGFVTNPLFWVKEAELLPYTKAIITLRYQTTGLGALIHFAEIKEGEAPKSLNSVNVALPDSKGAYKNFKFVTDIGPRGGEELHYCVMGTLGAAQSASLKKISMAMTWPQSLSS